MIEFFFQTRYYWPHEKATEDGGVVEKGNVHIKVNCTKFMLVGLRFYELKL